MIQVYLPGNTNFSSNGDMVIFPETAEITCEINGAWSATIIHPLDDEGRWEALIDNAVVKMPSWNGEQLFRIRVKDTSDMDGIVCELDPIFYDAAKDCFLEDVRPTNKNGQQALDILTAANTKYHGESNISVVSTAYYEFKNLLEAISGEEDNSFLNRWGGEIEYDNYTIRINTRLGSDKGFCFRYGRNIEGITETVDMSEVVTRIYPKAYNGRTRSGTKYIDSPLINAYPTIRSAVVEFDNVILKADLMDGTEVDQGATICETQADLDAALGSACQLQFDAGLDKPVVTVLIEGVVPELEEFNAAKIELGDTVHLIHPVLGISSEARIVSLTYDAIAEEVIGVTIGQTAYNYFNGVSSAVNRIQTAVRPDGSVRAETVKGVVDMKQANLYAQYDQAEAQDVIGILFENNDSTSQLYGAMAIGTQGFMIADTKDEAGNWVWKTWGTAAGLNADYITAGSIDASEIEVTNIDADNITSGTIDASTVTVENINASKITTGTLSASLIAAHSIGVSKLTGSISNNNWVIDLDNGTLTIGNISANNINTGTLSADRIAANSIAVSKLTGSISNNGWTIDLAAGTLTIGNISANNITSGALTIGGTGTSATINLLDSNNYNIGSWSSEGLISRLAGNSTTYAKLAQGILQIYKAGTSVANFGSILINNTLPSQFSTEYVVMKAHDNYFGVSSDGETVLIDAYAADNGLLIKTGKIYVSDNTTTAYEWSVNPVIRVTTPSFSSLPVTFNVPGLTAGHAIPEGGSIRLTNPSVQSSDWIVTTSTNSLKISRADGNSQTLSGSTIAYLTLVYATSDVTATRI